MTAVLLIGFSFAAPSFAIGLLVGRYLGFQQAARFALDAIRDARR